MSPVHTSSLAPTHRLSREAADRLHAHELAALSRSVSRRPRGRSRGRLSAASGVAAGSPKTRILELSSPVTPATPHTRALRNDGAGGDSGGGGDGVRDGDGDARGGTSVLSGGSPGAIRSGGGGAGGGGATPFSFAAMSPIPNTHSPSPVASSATAGRWFMQDGRQGRASADARESLGGAVLSRIETVLHSQQQLSRENQRLSAAFMEVSQRVLSLEATLRKVQISQHSVQYKSHISTVSTPEVADRDRHRRRRRRHSYSSVDASSTPPHDSPGLRRSLSSPPPASRGKLVNPFVDNSTMSTARDHFPDFEEAFQVVDTEGHSGALEGNRRL